MDESRAEKKKRLTLGTSTGASWLIRGRVNIKLNEGLGPRSSDPRAVSQTRKLALATEENDVSSETLVWR